MRFVGNDKETCRLNEDRWKNVVVKKADKHGVAIQGLNGIEALVEGLRSDPEHGEPDSEKGFPINHRHYDDLVTWNKCYRGEEMWGIMPVPKLNQVIRRSWDRYIFYEEVCSYLCVLVFSKSQRVVWHERLIAVLSSISIRTIRLSRLDPLVLNLEPTSEASSTT